MKKPLRKNLLCCLLFSS